tara:strand:+ start:433 stop:1383 length:951 start_codon:yes stop_codon:yes gene_type:complete
MKNSTHADYYVLINQYIIETKEKLINNTNYTELALKYNISSTAMRDRIQNTLKRLAKYYRFDELGIDYPKDKYDIKLDSKFWLKIIDNFEKGVSAYDKVENIAKPSVQDNNEMTNMVISNYEKELEQLKNIVNVYHKAWGNAMKGKHDDNNLTLMANEIDRLEKLYSSKSKELNSLVKNLKDAFTNVNKFTEITKKQREDASEIKNKFKKYIDKVIENKFKQFYYDNDKYIRGIRYFERREMCKLLNITPDSLRKVKNDLPHYEISSGNMSKNKAKILYCENDLELYKKRFAKNIARKKQETDEFYNKLMNNELAH